jgi:hypothetical protein
MLDAKTNLPSSRIILLHRTEYRIEPFALPDGLHSAEIVWYVVRTMLVASISSIDVNRVSL